MRRFQLSPTSRSASLLLRNDPNTGKFEVACGTSFSAHASMSHSFSFSEMSATTCAFINPDRAFQILIGASGSFINPDRVFAISIGSEPLFVANQVHKAGASISLNASALWQAKHIHKVSYSIAEGRPHQWVANQIHRFFYRGKSKASLSMRPRFEVPFKFVANAEAKLDFVSRHYADMRMRGRSRTIMRIRSGPWPW